MSKTIKRVADKVTGKSDKLNIQASSENSEVDDGDHEMIQYSIESRKSSIKESIEKMGGDLHPPDVNQDSRTQLLTLKDTEAYLFSDVLHLTNFPLVKFNKLNDIHSKVLDRIQIIETNDVYDYKESKLAKDENGTAKKGKWYEDWKKAGNIKDEEERKKEYGKLLQSGKWSGIFPTIPRVKRQSNNRVSLRSHKPSRSFNLFKFVFPGPGEKAYDMKGYAVRELPAEGLWYKLRYKIQAKRYFFSFNTTLLVCMCPGMPR